MIEGYVGLIGGGKSYNATLRMLEYMASGGAVYTNMTLVQHPWYNLRYAHKMREFKLDSIPDDPEAIERCINGQHYLYKGELCICRIDAGTAYCNSIGYERYLKQRYRWQVQPGQYNKLSNDMVAGELNAVIPVGTPEKPVLVVLDEAVDFFDADDRRDANREFLSFLRHSRKQAVDLIFIAQEYSELNKRIRNQTHFIWTFWDMQTFRVPGLRSTLPPPWKNMILAQQWNRNMTGGPTKRIWRSRDTDIFGCYRTDELFRALKSADGETDFSGKGNIIKKGKRMNALERAALFICLLLSVLEFFSGNPPANAAALTEHAAAPISETVEPTPLQVQYSRFRYWKPNGEPHVVEIDGIRYTAGQQTPKGLVLHASPDHVHIRAENGQSLFIYPSYDHLYPTEKEETAPRPESIRNKTQDKTQP